MSEEAVSLQMSKTDFLNNVIAVHTVLNMSFALIVTDSSEGRNKNQGRIVTDVTVL